MGHNKKHNNEVNAANEVDQEENSLSFSKFLVKNIFEFLITLTTGVSNLMNGHKEIMWGLILLALVAVIQGSPIVENEATSITSLESLISSVGQNNNFVMYSAESFEASSFVTRLSEVKEEEFYGIEMACDAIPIQQDICINHPASCQSTQISISNLEATIKERSQTLYSVKR